MLNKRREVGRTLIFAVVLFTTLAFVTIGCASGTTPPEEAWSEDIRLTTDSAWSEDPAIAVDTTNNVHITWYDYRDGTI